MRALGAYAYECGYLFWRQAVKVQCVVVSRLRILQFSAWLAYGLECIESLDLVSSWVPGQETIDQEFLGYSP